MLMAWVVAREIHVDVLGCIMTLLVFFLGHSKPLECDLVQWRSHVGTIVGLGRSCHSHLMKARVAQHGDALLLLA
jgi:hypothetical protein